MIPRFPDFKSLSVIDRPEIESFTMQYKPYSDFNFISLWGYNTNEDSLVSILNENLVFQYSDYITNESFYTFFGNNKVEETSATLLQKAKESNMMHELVLMTEETIRSSVTYSKNFVVKEDIDNNDYIYRSLDWVELKGKLYMNKRNYINRFLREYTHTVELIEINNESINEILRIFDLWAVHGEKKENDIKIERKALMRTLIPEFIDDLVCLGIIVDQKFIAFSLFDLTDKDYAQIHFEKADTSYKGVYAVLNHELAKMLVVKKRQFINLEQDCGIEGLRISKMGYHPIFFLKKFRVREK